jgi:hypothetical protein
MTLPGASSRAALLLDDLAQEGHVVRVAHGPRMPLAWAVWLGRWGLVQMFRECQAHGDSRPR